MRFATRSSVERTSGTPRTRLVPSSTPMTTVPPAVLANAMIVFQKRFGGRQISLVLERLTLGTAQQRSEVHYSAFYSEVLRSRALPSSKAVVTFTSVTGRFPFVPKSILNWRSSRSWLLGHRRPRQGSGGVHGHVIRNYRLLG
jgi:hypothetical protein